MIRGIAVTPNWIQSAHSWIYIRVFPADWREAFRLRAVFILVFGNIGAMKNRLYAILSVLSLAFCLTMMCYG